MTLGASCFFAFCYACSLLTVGWGGEELMCAGLRNTRPALEFCFYLLRFSVSKSIFAFHLLPLFVCQVRSGCGLVSSCHRRDCAPHLSCSRCACHSHGWIVRFRSGPSVLKTALDSTLSNALPIEVEQFCHRVAFTFHPKPPFNYWLFLIRQKRQLKLQHRSLAVLLKQGRTGKVKRFYKAGDWTLSICATDPQILSPQLRKFRSPWQCAQHETREKSTACSCLCSNFAVGKKAGVCNTTG